MRTLIMGLILASLLLSGCTFFGGEQNVTNETPPPPPPPPVKAPIVTITAPGQGEVILTQGNTADVDLVISTQNLLLKAPGGTAKKGEGHFRITVDDGVPQTITSKTYTMTGLSLGSHTVKVELLNNDRTQYSPAIEKTVTFTVEKEQPPEYVPQDYTVTISDSGFDPASLTVKVGDSVTWVNSGKMPQTATCYIAGNKVFDTQTLGPGTSGKITFTEEFTCEYYSQLFRALTGTITVESNGTQTQ